MANRLRTKTWSLLIGGVCLVIVAGIGAVVIQKNYFFNPITFRNNDVLYLPWRWYTKPLNMQIYTLTRQNKIVTVENSAQIRHVITELETGSKAKDTIDQMSKPTGPTYGIIIRTHNTTVLQTAILYANANVAQIATQHGNGTGYQFISLTPNLLQYVEEQLG